MDHKLLLPKIVETLESHEKNLQRAGEQISFLSASIAGVLQQVRLTKEQVQHIIDEMDKEPDEPPAEP